MLVSFSVLAAVGLIIVAMVFVIILQRKSVQSHREQAKAADNRAVASEKRESLAKKNIEAVLDYDKQDKAIQKKTDQHVEALVKTRSKNVATNEVKNLMADLRTAYNAQ